MTKSTLYREALPSDVFRILHLYQKAKISVWQDTLFLDYKRLETAIGAKTSLWLVAENGTNGSSTCIAALSFIVDENHGLSKITRMLIDPEVPQSKEQLRELLRYSLTELKKKFPQVDVVYTTTLSMSLSQQELTLEEGFNILGVFPNAIGEDQSRLNGVSAYFYEGVLQSKRPQHFSIHKEIKPFFDLAQRECHLPPVEVAKEYYHPQMKDFEPLPTMEMIRASAFVRHRFDELIERRSQFLNFFPFYHPNTLITDPAQEIEVFVQITQKKRFAAIIGEHLEISVNPIELYQTVLSLLKSQNIAYVEIINDAADAYGTECIIAAGFTPCAYLPAFKRQDNNRRDFVVFGRSFEYLHRPNLNCHRSYVDFYLRFLQSEQRHYPTTEASLEAQTVPQHLEPTL